MRCALPIRFATLFLLISFASALGGCLTTAPVADLTPKAAVRLPSPPPFMNVCPESGVTVGMQPNEAFDLERAARKACSRNGAAARAWYLGVRKRYGTAKLGS